MEIVCLDLEGVLVPEIWIAFAEETGIPELKRTTRDEPDYDKLMKYRLNRLISPPSCLRSMHGDCTKKKKAVPPLKNTSEMSIHFQNMSDHKHLRKT